MAKSPKQQDASTTSAADKRAAKLAEALMDRTIRIRRNIRPRGGKPLNGAFRSPAPRTRHCR
jgi:hypothetical protein